MNRNDQPPVRIPRVARAQKKTGALPFAIGLAVLGTGVFAKLADARSQREEEASALPPLPAAPASAPAAALAPAKPAASMPLAIPNSPVVLTATLPPATIARPVSGFAAPVPLTAPIDQARARSNAPTLIVDLAQNRAFDRFATRVATDGGGSSGATQAAIVADPASGTVVAAGVTGTADASVAQGGSSPAGGLSANERFAERTGGKQAEVARASAMGNLDRMVTQGTVIGAVMETALNSDLPGFARAVTTRDILSFDGSAVLIPAGSRVIGEYNSGVAQGASRIFIVWNRLIRPDGVSITLASPAVDDLGRGGLGGSVNRHFFQKYGTAILLSVLGGGLNALAQSRSNGSTVIVSNSSEATSLANQASRGSDVAPTIKTQQGALVRIFVARDLDFSAVGPVQ